jgi:hypothetical protein
LRLQLTLGFRFNLGFGFRLGVKLGFGFGFGFGFVVKLGFAAFAKLNEQFGGLFHTEDFIEGREAEADGRPPVYHGK